MIVPTAPSTTGDQHRAQPTERPDALAKQNEHDGRHQGSDGAGDYPIGHAPLDQSFVKAGTQRQRKFRRRDVSRGDFERSANQKLPNEQERQKAAPCRTLKISRR